MKLEIINDKEYLELIKNKNISLYNNQEALKYYDKHEIIKISNQSEILCLFLIPLKENGIRRKYRFFPYTGPIFLKELNNTKQKEILKIIFNYLFNKYEYAFIPLNPDFKMVSSLCSEGALVEMRHTHITNEPLKLEKLSSKLRNHINSSSKKINIEISTSYENYDFNKAIVSSGEELTLRTNLAKELLNNNKAITVIAYNDTKPIAGLVIAYDNDTAYMLHSYQDKTIRGVIPALIYKATEYCFKNLKIKNFDFEGSVIDEIDDFFTNFNINITTYPYIIYSKNKQELIKLIDRSMNIEGRIRRLENDKS